jgi:inosose dehydratase
MTPKSAKTEVPVQVIKITRRQFTGAALVAGAAAICRAGDVAPVAEAQPTSCTLGFGTYGMKSLTTEQAIRAIGDIGFDSVMVDCVAGWDADPANMSSARRADVRALLKDRGLKLPALEDDLRAGADDKKNAQQEEHLKAVAQLCHDLSPDMPAIIETTLGGRDEWPKAKPLFLSRLESWAKVAEASDVTIAIKPHADTSMSRTEQALEVFRELGPQSRIKLCYDYSHFVFTDVSMEQTIRMSLPWTVSVVMKDAVMENRKRVFKIPGETGSIDYPAMLKQFYAGGYRGDFSCEISAMVWHKPGYDGVAAAKQCFKNLAPAFTAAGVPRPVRK